MKSNEIKKKLRLSPISSENSENTATWIYLNITMELMRELLLQLKRWVHKHFSIAVSQNLCYRFIHYDQSKNMYLICLNFYKIENILYNFTTL